MSPWRRSARWRRPARRRVVFEPAAVQEGRTALIKVLPPAGATIESARLGDRTLAWTCCLPFTPGGARGFQWAVAGAPVYQGPDSLTLTLTVRLPGGDAVTVTRSLLVLPGGYPTLREVYNGPRLAPAARDAEHATIAAVVAARSGAPAWSGPFQPPLRGALTVNAPFGQRRAYNQEPPYEVHTGVDLAASQGTPVYAPAAGRVVWAQPLRLRGNTVIIDHGAGVFTLYAHLSAYRVAAGQTVRDRRSDRPGGRHGQRARPAPALGSDRCGGGRAAAGVAGPRLPLILQPRLVTARGETALAVRAVVK